MTHEHPPEARLRQHPRPGGGEPLTGSEVLLASELLRSMGVEWPPTPGGTPEAPPPRPALQPSRPRVSDPEAFELLYGMGME